MNRKLKLRKKSFYLKPRDIMVLICLLIIVETVYLVIKFNIIVTPKLLEIADIKLHNMVSIIINKSFEKDVRGENFDEIIMLDVNNEQINGVNFNMEKIYEMAELLTNKFHENMAYIENGEWDKIGYQDLDAIKSKYGYVLALPVGIASKNIFMANLGPKIPVKIKLVGANLNTIETKITDYGINNALVEVYIDMNIERQIITPVVFEREKISYKFLISSRIVQGKVPLFYNGLLTKGTNLNIPIS